jgi:hypothetical protein
MPKMALCVVMPKRKEALAIKVLTLKRLSRLRK